MKIVIDIPEETVNEMKDDWISREQAKKFLYEEIERLHDDGLYDCFSRIIDDMYNELPSVTPQPTRWIPCSERLPEEEGWYLVTIQSDKTEKRRTENDLFAIGIAEAHKHTPYKFCKDGHRQTVVAWMPIPEPYKGE